MSSSLQHCQIFKFIFLSSAENKPRLCSALFPCAYPDTSRYRSEREAPSWKAGVGLNCHCFLLITQKAAIFSVYPGKFFSSQLVKSVLLFLLLKSDEDPSFGSLLGILHHESKPEGLSSRTKAVDSERRALCAWQVLPQPKFGMPLTDFCASSCCLRQSAECFRRLSFLGHLDRS